MAKEGEWVPKQRLAMDDIEKFELEEHLQPTKTCNPKTQTQCAKKRQFFFPKAFNCPFFHSLHT
jgi:hypothetical protein